MLFLDYAGGFFKKLTIEHNFSAYRNNISFDGEELISNLKDKLKKQFNAENYNVHIMNGNITMISNFLSSAIKNIKNISISPLEHHSMFLPWVKKNYNVVFSDMTDYIPIHSKGFDLYLQTYISNVTGNCYEDTIKNIVDENPNSLIIIDGAQCLGLIPNLNELKCDGFLLSSSKLLSLPGLGILFTSKKLENSLEDYLVGGGKNLNINLDKRYEDYLLLGTPNFPAIFSLNNAELNYHDDKLFESIFYQFENEFNWKLLQNKKIKRKSIYSFITNNHFHDISSFLLENDIIIRDGNMCCSQFFDRINKKGCLRFSTGLLSTKKEINYLFKILKNGQKTDNILL